MPWLGYLHKISRADRFVFLDDVQLKKNEFQNRNRLLIAGQPRWLTVPVSFRFGDTLRETRIAETGPWRQKMLRTVIYNYAAAPFFAEYRAGLERLINGRWDSLSSLNAATVRWLMECFGLCTQTVSSSELGSFDTDPTGRLIAICRRLGADVYLSGEGGRSYLDLAAFSAAGIRIEFQDFRHPVYSQRTLKAGAEFVPRLSALDALFNCGGGSKGAGRLGLG